MRGGSRHQGVYRAPPAKQTSNALHREICDDKETNDDTEDKRVAQGLTFSFLFYFFWPQIQRELCYSRDGSSCVRVHAILNIKEVVCIDLKS